jgi:hypothetical protein
MAIVGGSHGQKMPFTSRPKAIQQVLGRLIRSFACGAGALIGGDKLNLGKLLLQRIDESRLTLLGARRADRVAQENHIPFSAEQLAEMLAGHHAAFVVIEWRQS